jgi:hypothetical protein
VGEEVAERLPLSEATRADLQVALLRAVGLVLGGLFFFCGPAMVLHEAGGDGSFLFFLPRIAVATVPLTFAERWCIRRGVGAAPALLAALAVWIYVWVAIVACRFQWVYTCEALQGRGFAGGLDRLGLELRWILQTGPPDGASAGRAGPRTMAAIFAARVPRFFAPTMAATFFAQVAGARRSWRLVVPVVLALLAAGVPIHGLIADRMPPFTYKYPGWNGTQQVLWYAFWAEVFGFAGVFVVAHLSGRGRAVAKAPDQGDTIQP